MFMASRVSNPPAKWSLGTRSQEHPELSASKHFPPRRDNEHNRQIRRIARSLKLLQGEQGELRRIETCPQRLELAAEAVSTFATIQERFLPVDCQGEFQQSQSEEPVIDRASNWPSDQLLRSIHSLVMGMALWASTILYGAVHTAARNSYFPLNIERWLWRASSIWMLFCGGLWILINFLASSFRPIDRLWVRFNHRQTKWYTDAVIKALCTLCGIGCVR
jgi:hypothetical protein